MQHADKRRELFVNCRIRAIIGQDEQQRLAAGKQAHGLT